MSDKGYNRPTARSRELRANMTPAERKLWACLSARKVAGVRFNTQFPIGPHYIADFASRGAKLVIEVDGGQVGRFETGDRLHQLQQRARKTFEIFGIAYRGRE